METLKIRTRDRRIVPLRFNAPQERVWAKIAPKLDANESIRLIILKARREGISTLIEALLMAFIAGHGNVNALVTAHMKKPAHKIWSMSKLFVTSSPMLRPLAGIGNSTITFGNSSLEVATAGSPESERGGDLTAAHFSEGAFYPHKGFLTAAMQALPHRHDIFSIGVIESTANGFEGEGEDFYNEWERAEQGDSDWLALFLAWFTFPEYYLPGIRHLEDIDAEERELMLRFELSLGQLAWRRWAIKNNCKGQVEIFHQEYPACLVGETRVSTDIGILPLNQVVRGRLTESGPVGGLKPQGKQPVYRAITKAGREIVGTADHPIQKADGKFVDLAESAGAVIALRPPRFADNKYRESWETIGGLQSVLTIGMNWARFLGYFMGDGCYHNGTVSITCDGQDEDVVEDVRSTLLSIFGKVGERRTGPNRGCVELRVGCSDFADVMWRLGIYHPEKPHRRVCVPEAIFRSPKDYVKPFLQCLFEADGFNGYRCNRVVLFSKWPQFLRDVQLLLLGFGITSRISERPARTGGHAYVARTLTLRSNEAIKFNQEIGFVGARKRSRGTARKARPGLPIVLEDRVVSVALAGEEEVYDLSILDGDHTFGANGIAVHNTAEEAFIQAGLPFFRAHELTWLDPMKADGTRYRIEPTGQLTRDPQGPLEIWKMPEPGHSYIVGADSSMGLADGEDTKKTHSRSAAEVIDMDTLEQVAEYDAAAAPHLFARALVGIGRLYNEALIAPEVQSSGGGGGREVLVYMRDLDYYNLHRWRSDPDKIQRQPAVMYGWETNSRTRPRMLARIREVIMEKSVMIHSRRLIKQLSTFGESDSGRMEALAGRDDLLFAWGIALMSRSENYFKMPAVTSSIQAQEVSFDNLGIHFRQEETVQQRIRRIMQTPEPDERTFMEY